MSIKSTKGRFKESFTLPPFLSSMLYASIPFLLVIYPFLPLTSISLSLTPSSRIFLSTRLFSCFFLSYIFRLLSFSPVCPSPLLFCLRPSFTLFVLSLCHFVSAQFNVLVRTNSICNASTLLVWDLGDEEQEFKEVIVKNPHFVFRFCLPSFLLSARRCRVFPVSQTVGAELRRLLLLDFLLITIITLSLVLLYRWKVSVLLPVQYKRILYNFI